MTTISKLKLVSSKEEHGFSPINVRRNKMISKIEEQIKIVSAQIKGEIYSPRRTKIVTVKETGERKTVEVTKRVKTWFWKNNSGKIHLSLRYGSRTLELAKGKNAIEVNNSEELLTTLSALKEAVIVGELDDAIGHAIDKLKIAFVK